MTAKTPNSNRLTPGGMRDRREAQCSVCKLGIFEDQPREWCSKPLGLVHPECMPPQPATSGASAEPAPVLEVKPAQRPVPPPPAPPAPASRRVPVDRPKPQPRPAAPVVPQPEPAPVVPASRPKRQQKAVARCRVCDQKARTRRDGRVAKHWHLNAWCDGEGRMPKVVWE